MLIRCTLTATLLFALQPGRFPAQMLTPQHTLAPSMTFHVVGPFDVKLTPQPLDDTAADCTLSRMAIEKRFHCNIEATSKGEMLAAGTPTKGSAVYLAMERVTGTLGGRTGTFIPPAQRHAHPGRTPDVHYRRA